MDVFKSFGSQLFGKTVKKAAKKGAEKALTAAGTKTGEHVGKNAGDKIVKVLSKSGDKPNKVTKAPQKVTFNETVPKKMTDFEINQGVNQILSGDGILKRKII